MMAWIRGHLGYNGSCLSEVASNQHTNTYVFLLLKLLSIRRSFPVLVLKAHVFCRPTHFPVKKSHPINACHPDSTFYPRAASAYPESWMVWDGACPMLEAATRFWPKPFAVRGTMIPPYRAAILNSCVLTLASQKARSFWTTPVAMRLAGSPATMLVTSCPRMQSSPTSL